MPLRMPNSKVWALVFLFVLSGCFFRDPFTDSIPAPPPPESLPTLPPGPHLRVLVLGDWGTGDEGQRELARAMAATHGDAPPDFVLTVGDNFYPDGVTGPEDPMWESHFETVYSGPFWEDMQFQAILGNHDHHGNPDGQVAYSLRSGRWSMPSRYYVVEREVPGGGKALFLALDTEPIESRDATATSQLAWADSIIGSTPADWVVVAGHHPVATAGWHGPQRSVREALLPLLIGRAHLYVSGHNHSTELLRTQAGTLQAVCGGGGGLDNPYRVGSTDSTLASFTNGGWCFLRIWTDSFAVELYDREGRVQFRQLIMG